MTPTHATKSGTRYRYYVLKTTAGRDIKRDAGQRIPASNIEALSHAPHSRLARRSRGDARYHPEIHIGRHHSEAALGGVMRSAVLPHGMNFGTSTALASSCTGGRSRQHSGPCRSHRNLRLKDDRFIQWLVGMDGSAEQAAETRPVETEIGTAPSHPDIDNSSPSQAGRQGDEDDHRGWVRADKS